jgi:hypothetical protein
VRDPQSPLTYAIGDPYLNVFLLAYVLSDYADCILAELPVKEATKVRKAAGAVKPHPSIDGWLLVCKRIRGSGYRWLTCPPISYRWDIIAGVHDALGHAGVEQVLAYMHQFYHWRGIKADIARYVKQCDACQKRKLVLPPCLSSRSLLSMGLLIICILTSVVPSQPLLWMFMGRLHGLKPHRRLGLFS